MEKVKYWEIFPVVSIFQYSIKWDKYFSFLQWIISRRYKNCPERFKSIMRKKKNKSESHHNITIFLFPSFITAYFLLTSFEYKFKVKCKTNWRQLFHIKMCKKLLELLWKLHSLSKCYNLFNTYIIIYPQHNDEHLLNDQHHLR